MLDMVSLLMEWSLVAFLWLSLLVFNMTDGLLPYASWLDDVFACSFEIFVSVENPQKSSNRFVGGGQTPVDTGTKKE